MEKIIHFYQQLIKLLKRDWPIFVIMALLFVAGIWLGTKLPQLNPELAKIIEKEGMKKLSSMVKWLKGLPFIAWILMIWLNNLLAATVAFFSGVFLVPPAFNGVTKWSICGFGSKDH